jgi:hypothetical protein
MPRKSNSQQTQRQDPADSLGGTPGDHTESPSDHAESPSDHAGPPGDSSDAAPDTWLDNPRNVQAFFDAIERARKAKSRERPS